MCWNFPCLVLQCQAIRGIFPRRVGERGCAAAARTPKLVSQPRSNPERIALYRDAMGHHGSQRGDACTPRWLGRVSGDRFAIFENSAGTCVDAHGFTRRPPVHSHGGRSKRGKWHSYLPRCRWLLAKLPHRGSRFTPGLAAGSAVGMGILLDASARSFGGQTECGTLRLGQTFPRFARVPIPLHPERGRSSRTGRGERRGAYARGTFQKPLRYLQPAAFCGHQSLRASRRGPPVRVRRLDSSSYLLVW